MFNRVPCVVALAMGLFAGLAVAENFTEAANRLCEKMKACSQQKMQGQGMTPEMVTMMTQMVDQACASVQQQYSPGMQSHALHDPAVNCMNSMAQQDCAVLDQGNPTEECRQLREMSRQQGE